jgi:flagellar motility protein MotE (MotC chaperone)
MKITKTNIKRIIAIFAVVNLIFIAAYGYLHSQSEAADTKQAAVKPGVSAAAPAAISADERWSALERRQEEQRVKEMELRTLEGEINTKLKKLEEIEALIRQDLSTLNTQSDERIKHLVKIYTSMNPKSAAKLMDNMDLLVAVEVFHNMKGEVAGAILANMEPTKAASITKMLASYRATIKQTAANP